MKEIRKWSPISDKGWNPSNGSCYLFACQKVFLPGSEFHTSFDYVCLFWLSSALTTTPPPNGWVGSGLIGDYLCEFMYPWCNHKKHFAPIDYMHGGLKPFGHENSSGRQKSKKNPHSCSVSSVLTISLSAFLFVLKIIVFVSACMSKTWITLLLCSF